MCPSRPGRLGWGEYYFFFWLNKVRPHFCPHLLMSQTKVFQTSKDKFGRSCHRLAMGSAPIGNACASVFSGNSHVGFALVSCHVNQGLCSRNSLSRVRFGKEEEKTNRLRFSSRVSDSKDLEASCQTLGKCTTFVEKKGR